MSCDPAQIAVVIGTRPEAIKTAPVLRALAERGLACALVCTGQHRDLDLAGAGIDRPATVRLPLDPGGLDADAMCDRIEMHVRDWLSGSRAALVLVQGDTNSALGAARAASSLGLPLAHVEAGLRTFDPGDPWPEERNRTEIDHLADLLFAPTSAACGNLRSEGVRGEIHLTGNSGIDAVLQAAASIRPRPFLRERPTILVTVHRRENRGAGIVAVGAALRRIADRVDVNIVVALHPNAGARAEMAAAVKGIRAVTLLEPQTHAATVGYMLASTLILTDSGGLQEEAPALGRPALILRASTERAEAIDSGNAILVGTNPDRIIAETLRLLNDPQHRARMSVPSLPFGNGGASAVMAAAIADFLSRPEARRPIAAAEPRLNLTSR